MQHNDFFFFSYPKISVHVSIDIQEHIQQGKLDANSSEAGFTMKPALIQLLQHQWSQIVQAPMVMTTYLHLMPPPMCYLTMLISRILWTRKGFFILINNFSVVVPQILMSLPIAPALQLSMLTFLVPWSKWEISAL